MDESKKLLGSGNYLAWMTYQKQILRSKGLFGYADGTLTRPSPPPAPTPGTTPPAVTGITEEAWTDRNGRAMAQITVNCNDAIMIVADAHTTAAETWKYLADKYQNTSWLARSLAKKRLTETQYTDGSDMPAHIDTLNTRLAECKAIGIKIEDGDFSMIITDSLPVSWDNLITALPAVITPDNLATKLCLKDNRRRARGLYPKPANHALYSAAPAAPAGPRRTGNKTDLVCSNCKRPRPS